MATYHLTIPIPDEKIKKLCERYGVISDDCDCVSVVSVVEDSDYFPYDGVPE